MEFYEKAGDVCGGGAAHPVNEELLSLREGPQPVSELEEMQACSACAGDYEDPDRTAGEEFEAMLAGGETDEGEMEFEE